MHYVAIGLTILVGLGIIFTGAQYLVVPEKMAKTFGLPTWPTGGDAAWLNLKGIRDIVSGLLVLIPLAMGEYRVLSWLLLAAALIPVGDAVTILRNHGNKTFAYAVHGSTALAIVITSILFLLG
jgi:hypothetical protein